jgi:hypothetical protein
VKQARSNHAYQLIIPFLREQGLPNQDDPYAPENIERALLCLDDEGWNKVERQSIIDGNLDSPASMFDDLEAALVDGEDFYEQLTKRFG